MHLRKNELKNASESSQFRYEEDRRNVAQDTGKSDPLAMPNIVDCNIGLLKIIFKCICTVE